MIESILWNIAGFGLFGVWILAIIGMWVILIKGFNFCRKHWKEHIYYYFGKIFLPIAMIVYLAICLTFVKAFFIGFLKFNLPGIF